MGYENQDFRDRSSKHTLNRRANITTNRVPHQLDHPCKFHISL